MFLHVPEVRDTRSESQAFRDQEQETYRALNPTLHDQYLKDKIEGEIAAMMERQKNMTVAAPEVVTYNGPVCVECGEPEYRGGLCVRCWREWHS